MMFRWLSILNPFYVSLTDPSLFFGREGDECRRGWKGRLQETQWKIESAKWVLIDYALHDIAGLTATKNCLILEHVAVELFLDCT